MDIREINDEYSVSGQITVEDLDAIAAMGFKSIVCHRPDFEAPDQPTFDSIAARAQELAIETMHITVGPMGVTAEAVNGMMDALDDLPRPMLGYCRSGMRSTKTYEQAQRVRD